MSRALNVLIDNQIVRKDRGRLVVLDEKALHRAARGEVGLAEMRGDELSTA